MGRRFTAAEGEAGAHAVAIISHLYWERRFGRSPEVVGSALILDGSPHIIVGVMPRGFSFLFDVDVWRPTRPDTPLTDVRRFHNWYVVGKLKPGVSLAQAQGQVDVIAAQLEAEYPETHKE